MSDIAVLYTLTTPGGTVVFNDGDLFTLDDMIYITGGRGLDGPPRRTPQIDLPQADGGASLIWRKGARHITIEGEFVVQSTRIETQIQTIRNQMAQELEAALDSILSPTTGTLAWTPLGLGAVSLDVSSEVELETDGVEQKTFTFGLYAGVPGSTLVAA